MKLLEEINEKINNSMKYLHDAKDKWQTPKESEELKSGDCEDYAIAKYFALEKLGAENTHIMGVMRVYNGTRMLHTICISNGMVLDNINRKVQKLSDRKDLIPIWAFNREEAFLIKKEGREYFDVKRIKKWQDLLKRI